MDPNATLAEMRRAIESGDYHTAAIMANDLDYWIIRGGFLPTDWQHA